MAMTPRARSAADSEASLARAPRSLNELVTWRFSYLTKTSAPVSADSRGAGSIGVRSTWPAITRRAASMSARVTVKRPLAIQAPAETGALFHYIRRADQLRKLLLGERRLQELVLDCLSHDLVDADPALRR